MDLKGFKCGWLDAGTSQSDDGPIGFPVRSSQSNLSLACLFERTRKLIEVNLSMLVRWGNSVFDGFSYNVGKARWSLAVCLALNPLWG